MSDEIDILADLGMAAPKPERWMRMAEIARLTGHSPRTIYRRIREGSFPAGKRISHKVAVWLESDVTAWQAQQLAKWDRQVRAGKFKHP
ncbi:helix-turn-helix transcriptional regulator [Brevundimonas sp. VNH65]|uniref:helix-turn-helix transcriptional regulator n=1 Tax=Brevundimonas sp. VNH65 TaxID=3400917 RepID=UPI003C09046F